MSEDEAVEILEDFKNNKLQRDKLEQDDRCGGFKMEKIYKKTKLNIAIETLLQSRKKDKAEIERLRYIKKNFDYVVQKENEKKDKIIDYMANFINDNTPYTKNTRVLENEREVRNTKYTKQYFERKVNNNEQ